MNIVIVGFMGTGKTTVARLVAGRLKLRYVSSDTLVEEKEKMRISEIFAQRGEPYFRQAESAVLRSLKGQDGLVIDCGGGIVINPTNRTILRELGRVIVLTATPEVIVNRTKDYTDRPLLQVSDPAKQILALLNQRQAWYQELAKDGIEIDTSQASPQAICEALLKRIA